MTDFDYNGTKEQAKAEDQALDSATWNETFKTIKIAWELIQAEIPPEALSALLKNPEVNLLVQLVAAVEGS